MMNDALRALRDLIEDIANLEIDSVGEIDAQQADNDLADMADEAHPVRDGR